MSANVLYFADADMVSMANATIAVFVKTAVWESYREKAVLQAPAPQHVETVMRALVLSDAMYYLRNRYRSESLKDLPPVSPKEVVKAAGDILAYKDLSERLQGRYSLQELWMRHTGGHRVSDGMKRYLNRALSGAAAVISPPEEAQTAEQMAAAMIEKFGSERFTATQREKRYREALKQLADRDSTKHREAALFVALSNILASREWEASRVKMLGTLCDGWEIEVIGELPESVRPRRYKTAS